MQANLDTLLAVVSPAEPPLFYRLLGIVLIATAAVIVLHLLLTGLRSPHRATRPAWNGWQQLIYLGTVLSVAVLGITSFYAVLRYQILDGWLLFVHMFGAGAFTALLPLLALAWCPAHRFVTDARETPDAPSYFFWLPKVAFWVMLAAGIVVTGSMLLSMLPLLGTDRLHMLLNVHRYSGLVVVVALLLHLYGVVLQRARLR
jgi:hypothetical protein